MKTRVVNSVAFALVQAMHANAIQNSLVYDDRMLMSQQERFVSLGAAIDLSYGSESKSYGRYLKRSSKSSQSSKSSERDSSERDSSDSKSSDSKSSKSESDSNESDSNDSTPSQTQDEVSTPTTAPVTNVPTVRMTTNSPTAGSTINVTKPKIQTSSPTSAPTAAPVTNVPTATMTTNSPTVESTIVVTKSKILTSRPTSNPTIGATDNVVQFPTGSPPVTNDPNKPCPISNGSFGTETAAEISVQYYYKMEHKTGSILDELMVALEHSITNVIVNSSGFFPSCGSSLASADSNVDNTVIIGITSDPLDRVNSSCGDTCVIVAGRLTLFVSPTMDTRTRRRLRMGSTEIEHSLDIIQDAMEGGELSDDEPDIISLTYLLPNDSSIVDGGDGELADNTGASEGDESTPISRGIPSYGYALIASATTILLGAVAVAARRRKMEDDISEDEEEGSGREALSPSKDKSIEFAMKNGEEVAMPLYDDQSEVVMPSNDGDVDEEVVMCSNDEEVDEEVVMSLNDEEVDEETVTSFNDEHSF